MNNRTANLPKWAQNEIYRLTSDNESLRKKITDMDSGESNIWFGSPLEKIHIPSDSTVTFSVNEQTIQLKIGRKGEVVDVYTGYGRVSVLPTSANSLELKVVEF